MPKTKGLWHKKELFPCFLCQKKKGFGITKGVYLAFYAKAVSKANASYYASVAALPTMAAFVAFLVSVTTLMAFMATLMTFLMVMVADCVRVVLKCSGNESLDGLVSIACNSWKELDSHLLQSHSGTHSDSATDQNLNLSCAQEACKCSMACSVCVDHL